MAGVWGVGLLETPRTAQEILRLRGNPQIAIRINHNNSSDGKSIPKWFFDQNWLYVYSFCGLKMGVFCSEEKNQSIIIG